MGKCTSTDEFTPPPLPHFMLFLGILKFSVQSDDLEFSSQKLNQLPVAFSFDNGVSYQLCFLPKWAKLSVFPPDIFKFSLFVSRKGKLSVFVFTMG